MHGSTHAKNVLKVLGQQRMEKFLAQSGNHAGRALKLYAWDAELSAAMGSLIAILEVVLRNKICAAIDIWSDQPPGSNKNWILTPDQNVQSPLSEISKAISGPAINKAQKAKEIRDSGAGLFTGHHLRSGHDLTRDDVIAQVSLTQWKQNFFYREPEMQDDGSIKFFPDEVTYTRVKAVYEEITHKALSGGPSQITPDRASLIMHHAVLLRNRISHQETLINIDCTAYRQEFLDLLKCLDQDVLAYYTANDPIPEILSRDPRNTAPR